MSNRIFNARDGKPKDKTKRHGIIRRMAVSAITKVLPELRRDPVTLRELDSLLDSSWGYNTAAGVEVTAQKALGLPAKYAAVSLAARSVGYLPLFLYEILPNNNKRKAKEHPLYDILHKETNRIMTAYNFMTTMHMNFMLFGNAYAEIIRDNSGVIREIFPWEPGKVKVIRDGWDKSYELSAKGGKVILPRERVLHVHSLSGNGLMGFDQLNIQKDSLAIGLAAQQFAAEFFKNGACPALAIQHPGDLSSGDGQAYKNLRDSLMNALSGPGNYHKLLLLEEGSTANKLSISPEDSQLTDTRKHEVTETARFANMPPHKLGDLEKASFSNIEHQGIEYVIYSMGPDLKNWQLALGMQLLTQEEKKKYEFRFNTNALLAGDTAARTRYYTAGRYGGWLTANQIRELENMNRREDPGGDEYMTPKNMDTSNQDNPDSSDKDTVKPDKNNGRSRLPVEV